MKSVCTLYKEKRREVEMKKLSLSLSQPPPNKIEKLSLLPTFSLSLKTIPSLFYAAILSAACPIRASISGRK